MAVLRAGIVSVHEEHATRRTNHAIIIDNCHSGGIVAQVGVLAGQAGEMA
jgi:hypothetical protein